MTTANKAAHDELGAEPAEHGLQSPSDSEPERFRCRPQPPSRQGVNVVLCDGSSCFVNNMIAWAVWQALGTSKGGEVVGDY